MTPSKTVLPPLPPVVKVLPPRLKLTPVVPGAASEPMVSLACSTIDAPVSIVTGEPSVMAWPPANCSWPPCTAVVPVNRLTPLSVTVPAVDLLAPAVPARMADTVPLRRSKAAVLVNTPVVPVMLPLFCKDTDATVSLFGPMARVPAPTVTALPSAITLLAFKARAPPNTLVAPV